LSASAVLNNSLPALYHFLYGSGFGVPGTKELQAEELQRRKEKAL